MTHLECLTWLVLFLDIQERTSYGGASILLSINYTTTAHQLVGMILRSTHNLSCGPPARLGGEKSARTPRAPAGDFAPCTPIYEWISE